MLFAKQETILPAPESAHAIKGAIDEALKCKESGEAKTILFGLTGTGYFDMTAYENYLTGKMTDYIPPGGCMRFGTKGEILFQFPWKYLVFSETIRYNNRTNAAARHQWKGEGSSHGIEEF